MTREWTILVYLGGDNDLEERCLDDLREMKTVGSSDSVAIVAQIDRMSDSVTRRYFVRAGAALEDDLLQELPEINTGDPATLVDFVRWATDSYPSHRTALILGSHGAGWKDVDIYRSAENAARERPQAMPATQRGADDADPPLRQALFLSTLRQILAYPAEERAIMFDDTSRDFLDSLELRKALCQLAAELGRPLDLIGFDACLMSALEIAFQLRGACRVMVGSQNDEPGQGWPYDRLLRRLANSPQSDAEALANIVVQEYAQQYIESPAHIGVTQSALRVDSLEPLAAAVDNLAVCLSKTMSEDERLLVTLMSVQRHVTRFSDRDYVDLLHLARLLAERADAPALQTDAQAVAALLEGYQSGSPIVAAGYAPPKDPASVAPMTPGWPGAVVGGLSVYWPRVKISPAYSQLEFARFGQWSRFLHAFEAL